MRAAVQGKNSTRIKRIPTNTDRTKTLSLDNKTGTREEAQLYS